MDTFQGAPIEPETLHKYLYVHADPVNNIDPSGNFALAQFSATINIQGILLAAAQSFLVVCTAEFAASSIVQTPASAPTVGCRNRREFHRGVIQAQGGGYQDSESWARPMPVSVSEGLSMLDRLVQRMPKRVFKARNIAIERARLWIIRVSSVGGAQAFRTRTWQNPGSKKGERIDIEIREGRAFIP